MAIIPKPDHTTAKYIYETYEQRAARSVDDGNRMHLGASEIGDDCARKNWYSFRWSLKSQFSGRMLRLFKRGHREEPEMIADLRAANITVHDLDERGNQYGFSMWGGHFAGHFDGVAKGFPEAPTVWHVTEFKTHKDELFKKLVKDKVKVAQPKHFVQCQLYMGHSGVKRAMYVAVNKNDDDIYTERIEFDQEVFDKYVAKAEQVIFSDAPPPRISEKPDFWKCTYCDYRSICHEPRVPEVTCRSCAHVTPERDGRWSCAKAPAPGTIPEAITRTGCLAHRYIPVLLDRFARVKAADDAENWVQYELTERFGGGTFVNGPSPGLSSAEIRAQPDPTILAHPAIEEMKAQFPGAKLLTSPEST